MHPAQSKQPGLLASLERAAQRDRASAVRYPIPPVLYVPVRESAAGRIAEVRPTREGRRALLAYSALDRLLAHCGDAQPWVLVRLADLEVIMAEQPFDLVAFDSEIPVGFSENGRLV
ncbi:SAV_915 family protein [Leucobacter chromiiresistens]|uniref:SseB protein N-terminal domain-containing protein n=1 Tax=Leucobacter chromiiresistens TaxID=1079994 RepID=A0A1H0Y3V8_9MICO|nr:SAV_915 family protein [Leucobacter chromiiresistens]SDQ09775.1 hypothetical protein SAMN04488565_0490 [Leucobacter chromiiresistens]